ncbi:type III secretion system effector protein [Streptomyces kronopolitis]|uniref:hypothetical protein n=1 Tax=Streptomyces kronopolitis TaxID=1612435 RepID=UPI0036B5CDEC
MVGAAPETFHACEIQKGVLAVRFANLANYLGHPDCKSFFAPVSDDEFLRFIQDTLQNFQILKSRPNGNVLVDFFSSNKIVCTKKNVDYRIDRPGGGKLEATLILSPSRSEIVEIAGELVELGATCETPLHSGAWSVEGSPSVIQYDPREATVHIGAEKSHMWPWETLAHELVHAVHSTSGTRALRGSKYEIYMPDRQGQRSLRYVIRGEEVFTHSRPEVRRQAAEKDGVLDFARVRVNGRREQVMLSAFDVGMMNDLCNRIKRGKGSDNLQTVLTTRMSMFGIGEWQIIKEFDHSPRSMYEAPEGMALESKKYRLDSRLPLESLAMACKTVEDAVSAGLAKPLSIVSSIKSSSCG